MSNNNRASGGDANQVSGGVNMTGGNITGDRVNLGTQGDVVNSIGGDFIKGGEGGHINKSGQGGDVVHGGKGGAGGNTYGIGKAGQGGPAQGANK